MKLIKLYSDTCIPCKHMEEALNLANIPHDSIDIQSKEGLKLVDTYSIRAVPTLLIFDDNNVLIKKVTGLVDVSVLKNTYGF